jgi:hypothetical protein
VNPHQGGHLRLPDRSGAHLWSRRATCFPPRMGAFWPCRPPFSTPLFAAPDHLRFWADGHPVYHNMQHASCGTPSSQVSIAANGIWCTEFVSYFLAKPATMAISLSPFRDPPKTEVGGLSTKITYCSAQGVTRSALSSPYRQNQTLNPKP